MWPGRPIEPVRQATILPLGSLIAHQSERGEAGTDPNDLSLGR